MYWREDYRASQFEPISAVNGGMRVSAGCGGAHSASYPPPAPVRYAEAAPVRYVPAYYEICIPADWLDNGDAPKPEQPAAEPPPYGGSLCLAPSYRRYILQPNRESGVVRHPRSEPEPEPTIEPQPEPKPKSAPPPAVEYKPFHPSITTTPPEAGREGEEYVYQARAHDGVATGFQWSLEGAPPGMRIDRHSGRLVWTPGRGGWYTVRLTAFSVYGKSAVQTWTILVRKAVKVTVHRPNPRYRAALDVRASSLAARREAVVPFPPPPLRVWREYHRPVAVAAASPPARRPARVTPAFAPRLNAPGHLL